MSTATTIVTAIDNMTTGDDDFYNNNTTTNMSSSLLSCDIFASSCEILEEVIYPTYQDALYADDTTWILTASFVILTMQSGFGLLEIGVSSPGNEVNVMLKNVCDILFGALAFYLYGYGVAYGTPSNGFMGLGDFVPTEDFDDPVASGIMWAQYLFQLSFAATSTTIVSGGIAMRMKFKAYCLFAFWAVTVYCFVAHWVWGPKGWLGELGVHDFAGGGPVHLLGGFNAFVAILFVGPRKGRFDGTRPESDFVESSPTGQLFGLLILWFAWIGFNCGSSFGITEERWLVATRTSVSTMNASAGGGIMGLIYSQWATKRSFVRPFDIVNGVLGGLVSSSPTCACVQTYEAMIIGAIGSLLACWTNEKLFRERMKIDDPVGAVGAHASAAMWGILAVGLFADSRFEGVEVGDGLFKGGGFKQLGLQFLEIVAICSWSMATMGPFFYLVGISLSKNWKDPRSGLVLHFPEFKDRPHQADPRIHDCMEDNVNVDDILDKIKGAFYDEIRDDLLQMLLKEQRGGSCLHDSISQTEIPEETDYDDISESNEAGQGDNDQEEHAQHHQQKRAAAASKSEGKQARPKTLQRRDSAVNALKSLFRKDKKFLGIPFQPTKREQQQQQQPPTS